MRNHTTEAARTRRGRIGAVGAALSLALVAGGAVAAHAATASWPALDASAFPPAWAGTEGVTRVVDDFDDETWFHNSTGSEPEWREWTRFTGANNPAADIGVVYAVGTPADAERHLARIALNRSNNHGNVSIRVELNQAAARTGTDLELLAPARTTGDLAFLFEAPANEVPRLTEVRRLNSTGDWSVPITLTAEPVYQASQATLEIELDLTAIVDELAARDWLAADATFASAAVRTAINTHWGAQLGDWVRPFPIQAPAEESEDEVVDVALRSWITEVWRDGEVVLDRSGWRVGETFVDYRDDNDIDLVVEPGDVLVKYVVVLNQGTVPARIDELVGIQAEGLVAYDGDLAGRVNGDRVWQVAADGLLEKALGDGNGGDVLLAPYGAEGSEYELFLLLEVAEGAVNGTEPAELYSFVQVSGFSALLDGVWEPLTEDADSTASRAPVSRTRWLSNAVHGEVTAAGLIDVDKHDGDTVRVVATGFEAAPAPTPTPSPTDPADPQTPDEDGEQDDAAINEPPADQLPVTGAEAVPLFLAAVAALGGGAWLVVARRRRLA